MANPFPSPANSSDAAANYDRMKTAIGNLMNSQLATIRDSITESLDSGEVTTAQAAVDALITALTTIYASV